LLIRQWTFGSRECLQYLHCYFTFSEILALVTVGLQWKMTEYFFYSDHDMRILTRKYNVYSFSLNMYQTVNFSERNLYMLLGCFTCIFMWKKLLWNLVTAIFSS
jgi:hypothetical protein